MPVNVAIHSTSLIEPPFPLSVPQLAELAANPADSGTIPAASAAGFPSAQARPATRYWQPGVAPFRCIAGRCPVAVQHGMDWRIDCTIMVLLRAFTFQFADRKEFFNWPVLCFNLISLP
ncbi:hypothetical protein [Aeromonas molluscorum]|uniref:hypothetical protein n=1 Tax=Aeromonas molluscorum TaxID=271417 RepID=UPI003F1A113A